MNDTTRYTATFTLSQTGKDGEIESTLSFEPLASYDMASDDEEAPAAYEIMSHLVSHFLFVTGITDEDGELVDPELFHDTVKLKTGPFGSKLN